MTDDFFDFRRRLSAATHGPWRVHSVDFGEVEVETVTDLASGRQRISRVCECHSLSDADLIAHAPTDLRRLLDEVERLREALVAETKRRQGAEWRADQAKQEADRLRPVALSAERLYDAMPDQRHAPLEALLFDVRDWRLVRPR